jgi:5'-deoxynucleotidase YfbR-like HD superfamily hydrolase
MLFDHCQQAEERDEKETNISLAICAQLHKVACVLMHKGHLPPIKELGKTKTYKQIFEEIKKNMNQRQEYAQAATKVKIELMEEHLVRSAKTQTMIHDLKENLTRDMKTLLNNMDSHEIAL